jgi:hypothetical protein
MKVAAYFDEGREKRRLQSRLKSPFSITDDEICKIERQNNSKIVNSPEMMSSSRWVHCFIAIASVFQLAPVSATPAFV